MLHYVESGLSEAQVIVFLPGGGLSGWSWLPQTKRLSEYHCIVPDLPGHGQSPVNGPFKISIVAKEVAELIKLVSPGRRVHLVGLSLGGQTALELLSEYPELLDRVVISGLTTSPSGGMWLLAPLLRFMMLLYSPIQNTKFMIRANMRQLKIPEEYEEEFKRDTRQITGDLYLQILVESLTFPLPQISDASGLLVASGEKEPELIRNSARMIRDSHKGVQCVVAKGVGHNWSMEKPDLFADMVRTWIEHNSLPVELTPLQ